MTLISLIVVLFAERVATQSKYWQADFYMTKFHRFMSKRNLLDANTSDVLYLAIVIVPALLLFVLLQAIDSNFLRLIIDTAILMVCIGCPSLPLARRDLCCTY